MRTSSNRESNDNTTSTTATVAADHQGTTRPCSPHLTTNPPPLLCEPRPAAITLALSKITEEIGPVPSASEPYTRVTEEEEAVPPPSPTTPPLLALVLKPAAAPAAFFATRSGLPPCRISLPLPLLPALPPSLDDAGVVAGIAVAAVQGFSPPLDEGGVAPEGRGPTSKRRTGPSRVPTATMQPQASRHVG